jgi:signal transduction histidine kinase
VRIRFLHTETFRLSAIYAVIFAASVMLLGGLVLVITERAFRDQVVRFSQGDIAAIQNGYNSEGLGEATEVVQQIMAAPGVSDFFLLQKDGKPVAGNLPAMSPRAGVFSLTRNGHEILGAGKFLASGVYAWSGSDLARAQLAGRQIVQTMALLFAAALLLAVIGGAVVSRSFLRRSDAMARACRAIMDGDLKARIPVRGTQDELDRLAGTINEMLNRIAALMENLHQVTNDIAHDLRTPVTHLRQGLERARGGPEAEHAQALEVAIGKTDGILALFVAMLRIAEIEGGKRRAAFAPVALAGLLMRLHELFGPVAEAAGHSLAVDFAQDAEIRGDPALLTQMLSNLIENAILHTPPGTHIVLALKMMDGRAALTVADDGPGVPADEHAKLFQRLYRREASRTRPGYGLGLSTAQAIAELHGASIGVVPGSAGLAIRVLFPAPRTSSGS